MTAAKTVYCDGPNCDIHQGPHPESLPFRGWVRVESREPTDSFFRDFCSWECLIRYGAGLPLPEVIGEAS